MLSLPLFLKGRAGLFLPLLLFSLSPSLSLPLLLSLPIPGGVFVAVIVLPGGLWRSWITLILQSVLQEGSAGPVPSQQLSGAYKEEDD